METIKTIYKIGRGPSSSHTIGPDRAIRKFIDSYQFDYCVVELFGSLSLTGRGHLTDYVINVALEEANIEHEIIFNNSLDIELKHPNTMTITGYNNQEEVAKWTVYSVGGGNIEIEGFIANNNEKLDVYPHSTLNEITAYCNERKLSYLDYVNEFDTNIDDYLLDILDHMIISVENGINKDGKIHGELGISRRAKKLLESSHNDEELIVSAYAYAVSEENATGGIIVTAPTCGACGVVPAVLYYYYNDLGVNKFKLVNALKIAGLFGTLVRKNASISGAEAGCQAEVGTATSMAAAALIYLNLENPELIQYESAAEIAMEHSIGLTCDPILGYVQIPCIQRNAVGTSKARIAAKIAEFSSDMEVVDFDTICKVMIETGKDLAAGYRETSMLGLAKYFQVKKGEL